MRNKFVNLFFQDLTLSLKIIAVAFLVVLCLLLNKATLHKELETARLRRDNALAQELARQIPGLEKKIEILQEKGKIIGILPRKINFVLSGIFIKDGKPIALIGDNIYQKNDTINGFTILDITSQAVIIEEEATKQKREVRLPK